MQLREKSIEQAPAPLLEQWKQCKRVLLKLLLSAHADDLEGTSALRAAEALLANLERACGTCRAVCTKSTHTGIEHEKSRHGVNCGRPQYIENLKQMRVSQPRGMPGEQCVDATTHGDYQSGLGGAAWGTVA